VRGVENKRETVATDATSGGPIFEEGERQKRRFNNGFCLAGELSAIWRTKTIFISKISFSMEKQNTDKYTAILIRRKRPSLKTSGTIICHIATKQHRVPILSDEESRTAAKRAGEFMERRRAANKTPRYR
jgi:hypothetical protein